MRTSRRIFLKSAVGLTGAATAFHASAASRFLPGQVGKWKLADTKEYLNICCYCSGGCGTICSVRNGQLINIEGDPDNPVNLGGLCPKGAGLTGLRKIVDKDRRLVMHPHRLTQPLVRRPGSSEWEPISWSQAIDEMARKIKKTRDESYTKEENGVTVNRCEGIASYGAAQLNCEEAWLVQKFAVLLASFRSTTRLVSATLLPFPGLARPSGRGSMSSHWMQISKTPMSS